MRNLNFRHLFYFWRVAKERNLTRTAKQLRVAQSALSAQIRALEAYLGRPLFDRTGRALVLTEFGSTVLDYADGIFRQGQELMAAVRGDEGQRVQQLRVGAVATLSRNFLENLLKPLLSQTAVRLSLVSGGLDGLLEQLEVHQLDVVLTNRPVAAETGRPFRCQQVDRQSVCLVGPPRPRHKRFRLPQDLAGRRLVIPGISSDIRTQFDLWCERVKVRVEILAEVDDMAMLRLLARDSGAVTIVPEVVVQDELREGTLQRYSVLPRVFENFYAITATRRRHSPILQNLIAPRTPN